MHSFTTLKEEYRTLLKRVTLKRLSDYGYESLDIIESNFNIYQLISREIQIPWTILAVLHYRECGLSFNKHIHNGDLLWNRTVNVPAGRPIESPRPGAYIESESIGYSFFHSCQDWAKLKDSTLSIPRMHNWSNESILWFLESNNGFGYRYHNVNTPYLWSGTNHYTSGYYVSDGVFSKKATNEQIGCVPLLIHLRGLKDA